MRLDSVLSSFFLALTRWDSVGLRFYLAAGLPEQIETILAVAQFIR